MYIYDNVVFPKFQEDITYNKYEDNQDKLGTNFYSYSCFTDNENVYREELNTIISELNVSFKNCKFLDNVKLSRYNFTKDLDFAKCEFFGNFNLDNTNVKGRITFSKSFFYKKLDISLSSFSKLYINYSFIYEIKTTYTIFKELSIFSNNIFYSDVYFEMNTFEKMAYFRNSIFLKKLNLRDTIFKENKSFLGISFKLDNDKLNQMDLSEKSKKYVKSLEIEKEYFLGDRETARIIKDSFEEQNNIIEANKFYALEMKEREKELEEDIRKGKNFFEWIVFKIHGLSSNHSQDGTLALFWIFIVGFIASYYDFNLIQNSEDKYIHYNLSSIFKTIGLIFIILFIDRLCKIKDKFINISYFIISSYLIYIYATEDYLLSLFSQTINPFSVMKTNDPINGIQLFFKIIIAYLIYQLIISIRQNTRRK
ncbi:hypothetical protein ACN2C0_09165 [Aliarcobacter butzleri]|uniref:hypothetical protein n=1 Tax=Aliarcobacter butzleri TaxID=28197 RepID=UPI003AFAEAF5